ncbi:NB-ARC domain-containing protein [Acaryochloris sp. IP29b_bin.148]|uniref:NB-ARC domain-containing protein n=1 Tax=Acaryochloris sp. IP29b_bin.148 TaxID=2969218 RepID=UPI00260DF8F5|nr:NB-ARC domain-containing protein [Acaryochloris sp. IP29b_bin.148]
MYNGAHSFTDDTTPTQAKVADPLYLVPSLPQGQPESKQAYLILQRLFPTAELSNIQTTVFLQAWQGKTYQQIAQSTGYDADYIKDVGHKLWRKLSALLGESLSKHNFCSILRRRFQQLEDAELALQNPQESGVRTMQSHKSKKEMGHPIQVCDWGEAAAVPVFIGRQFVVTQLKRWILEDHNRLIGIFGLGGVGKTALAVKCVEQVQSQFDCIIWRSVRDQPHFDALMGDLIRSITGQVNLELPESAQDKVTLLLTYFNQHRCLLVLDDWFSVLQGDHALAGSYQSGCEPYGLLLRRISESRHKSCVLITSREQPIGLAFTDNEAFPSRTLYLDGLDQDSGRTALKAFGLEGPDEYYDLLLQRYTGNPHALRVAVKTITNFFAGNVPQFLERDELIYGDIRRLLYQQFSRLSKLEISIMLSLANLDTAGSLADIAPDISLEQSDLLLDALESLHRRSFIWKQNGYISIPQLLKEYIRASPHLDTAEVSVDREV